MRFPTSLLFLLLLAALVASGCGLQSAQTGLAGDRIGRLEQVTARLDSAESLPDSVQEFILWTGIVDGRMVYVGAGGEIDGIVNPDLVIQPGHTVHLTLINGDAMPHDLSIPDLGVQTAMLSSKDAAVEVNITVSEADMGTHSYFCTVPGHRQAGMAGSVIVKGPRAANN